MTKSYKDAVEIDLIAGDRCIIFEYTFKTPVLRVMEDSVSLTPKFQEFIETLESQIKAQMVERSTDLFNGKVFTQERIETSFDTAISGNVLRVDTSKAVWFGQDNKKCTPEESGTCVIKVNKVKFDGKFSLDLELLKVKAARKHERVDFFNIEEPEEIQEPEPMVETEQDFW